MIIDEQVKVFEREIAKVQKYLLTAINENIVQMDLFNIAPENLELEKLTNRLFIALEEGGYSDLISKNLADTKKLDSSILAEAGKRLNMDFGGISTDSLNGLLKMDYEFLQDIGEDAVKQVQQGLYQSVVAGRQYSEAITGIEDMLDNRLKRYATTYIRTAKNTYQQSVENEIGKKLGIEDLMWEYTGPSDDKTRPECARGLAKGKVTTKEKKAFQSATVPRYNCRHRWIIVEVE